MTHQLDNQSNISIRQVEINIPEILYQELYRLPHQKVVSTSLL